MSKQEQEQFPEVPIEPLVPGDPTEAFRRQEVAKINSIPLLRAELEEQWGKDNVWDTEGLSRDFIVESFWAPYVIAKRRSTGKSGSLTFQHHPRFYFDWKED